jgi:hypothetical protein
VGSLRLVPLAQGLTDFEAKVLTAQLGAEGIIWQVRGVVDSVYPLGDIDVLVPADELDVARPLVQASRSGAAGDLSIDEDERGGAGPAFRGTWWFGAALIGLATTFLLMRMLALG